MIHIYTDGAAIVNPGPGGYGVVLLCGDKCKELSQGYVHTTNNRMELMGVIAAIESLVNKETPLTIYSDSKYVIDSIDKRWVFGWDKKGWPDKIKNHDLWKRFLVAYRDHRAPIKAIWVKGHSTNEINNRCDVLATTAARSATKIVDHGFQQPKSHNVDNFF